MHAPPNPLNAAVEGCLDCCQQLRRLVVSLSPEQYRSTSRDIRIGAHARHVLDHIFCLLRGVKTERINYDARTRDPELETDPAQMLIALDLAIGQLRELRDQVEPAAEVRVVNAVAPSGQPSEFNSNWSRELAFLAHHTMHHLAMIVIAARGLGVEPPAHYGVAPSTLAALQRDGQPSR